ncbi:hypothetical protein B0I27_106126 [Arcticibacter pallidicorallinus]|uniref:Uncharacterized protein n=1 Tax=Arcticibacter pallidicorallinus TaxID=1259464 RepID=A0A2T0U375_9SPHI|nr:hypothetical protein B0I27_106126 [Arcticibacter pallidicorallinus]
MPSESRETGGYSILYKPLFRQYLSRDMSDYDTLSRTYQGREARYIGQHRDADL